MANIKVNRQRRIGIGLAVLLLLMAAIGSGVVGAQESGELEAEFDPGAMSNATMIALDLTVSEITDPGTLWLDDSGLHIRGLAGVDSISGDITGTATTLTNIDWAAPCNPETLVCQGTQTSFTQLTITNENGDWTGNMQLVIDPANDTDTIGAVLTGQGGNAEQALYLNEVTDRTDVSLSVTGYRIAGMKPVGGVNLLNNVCVIDEVTGSGGFQGNYAIEDSGALHMMVTSGMDTTLGMTVNASFDGARGSLMGSAVELGTAEGGSAGRFVLMGVDGEYAGYLGFGRTGTQLVESSLCSSGYEVHSFWIGEVYIGG